MIVQVFQVTGDVSRSVVGATLLAEIEVEQIPNDQDGFAADHGGDFIEIVEDVLA